MKFESTDLSHFNLFDYSNYRVFLNIIYEDLKIKNSRYSIRYIAKRFDLKSPASLSMILRGHRNPSSKLAIKICKVLKFSLKESQYFLALLNLEKKPKSDQEKLSLQKTLEKLNPRNEIKLIDEDVFAIISNWYFFVIRELINSENFKNELDWIYLKLNKKVSKSKIKNALVLLEKCELIQRKSNTYVSTSKQVESTKDIPSEALKIHHEQMIERGKESIRDSPLHLRDIASTTFNIDPDQIKQMKDDISAFRKSFCQKYEITNGLVTYQVNMQLFPITTQGE